MDVPTINEYLEKLLPPTIALIFTSIIGLVIGIYLEKFKVRLVYLKYKLFFNSLGTTVQNEFWGDIEVVYRGRNANHLNFVTAEIYNDSNIDLQNVNVDIWVDGKSLILGHEALYNEAGNAIYLEQSYYDLYSQVLQRNQDDMIAKEQNPEHVTPIQLTNEVSWVLTNKKFHLPILNRHTSIKVNLLLENFNGQIPQVRLSILHKSVKLVTQRDKAEQEKRLGINMILWGLIFYILISLFVLKQFPESSVPIILIGIAGVLYLVVGFFIYRIIKYIKRILS